MHGVFSMTDGIIRLTAAVADNQIQLSVCDNGEGIPEEKLHTILIPHENEESHEGDARRKIGLINVHQRLKLIYGDAYGLTIENNPDRGCCVSVHLPIQENADD